MNTAKVKTRFAPSPTGFLHIGGVRTALFCWLFAQKNQGEFVLRIENTDIARNVAEASELIIDAMNWLGLSSKKEAIYQSNRISIYKTHLEKLLSTKQAYVCNCSKERLDELRNEALKNKKQPKYDGHCLNKNQPLREDSVIRLKVNQEGKSEFYDETHKKLEIKNSQLDDLVIWRNDMPTYNFAVVIDDTLMKISHVIRGDDHINNTFRQLSIFKALGFHLPIFSHLPMILDTNGARLSKRNKAANVLDYKKDGYLPGALLNYLFRLGFSYGNQEIFSLAEMIQVFDLTKINKAAGSINPEKLVWLNQQYLQKTENIKLLEIMLKNFSANLPQPIAKISSNKIKVLACINMQKTRAKTLKELAEMIRIFYQTTPLKYDKNQINKVKNKISLQQLNETIGQFKDLKEFNQTSVHQTLTKLVNELFNSQFGKLAQSLRFILTSNTQSGDLTEVMELIGQNQVIHRLKNFEQHFSATEQS